MAGAWGLGLASWLVLGLASHYAYLLYQVRPVRKILGLASWLVVGLWPGLVPGAWCLVAWPSLVAGAWWLVLGGLAWPRGWCLAWPPIMLTYYTKYAR